MTKKVKREYIPPEKRPAVDAEKDLMFCIKPDHIAKGRPGDPKNCAAAVALMDVLGDVFEMVHFGPRIIKVYLWDRIIRYRTSAKLRAQIHLFDCKDGKACDARMLGEHTLSKIPNYMKLGYDVGSFKKKSNGGKATRHKVDATAFSRPAHRVTVMLDKEVGQ